ncbi:malate synthase G [Dactylosporangium roseum]|uniref:Malate synthase G n=1 Tax=Dactylosporangium roseum TaxID=47989 RepID=A0ABY5YXT9_9ACTN|nr:malate synthase G [Dactylosporangium roseum]UWZ34568.1 malate synthase G [Dactylosporangium roseum]
MSTDRVPAADLLVDPVLHRFVSEEALPGTGIGEANFWRDASTLIHALAPENRELLDRRTQLQRQIDEYWRSGADVRDARAHEDHLRRIGYLTEAPGDVQISTENVDPEIAELAGPQLVVPLLNARFALNAANARWGSLYDALYGTDAIDNRGTLAPGPTYNPVRGDRVIAWGRDFLDTAAPLTRGSHADSLGYQMDSDGLVVTFANDDPGRLRDPAALVGYRGTPSSPEAVLLRHHGLHIEIRIDRGHPVGRSDAAGVSDIMLESALTTIMDLEDSVAAVDAADKVHGYRNWLQLMTGSLAEEVTKDGVTFVRSLNPDRSFTTPAGDPVVVPGRALMLVRNVGLLMTTDAILDRDGREVPEGILDALMTALGGLHDLRGHGDRRNSRTGSVYIVKPKMHGPEEVDFTVRLFEGVERVLGLAPRTLKIGIMDEERRTTLNLKACVHAAKDRLVFVNTGFLDRTGDEIHTSMWAGPMVRKADMKTQPWIAAYEDSNVDIGLACGLQGRAQIGKGMWAAPDSMSDMLAQKVQHPESGASCAWVPSPTAAMLHATHYHRVDVAARQQQLANRSAVSMGSLLTVPIGDPASWSDGEVQAELDNNIQGVLGYVVRWIDAGIGCSKVPDIHGTQLMEDRATCRISSQHVANWLHHGVVGVDRVEETLRRMAIVVDAQNAHDPQYNAMSATFDGVAFRTARRLILDAAAQPSGYTEPILHEGRLEKKAASP